jgi:transcriptional regulator with XRE-family HTH domain
MSFGEKTALKRKAKNWTQTDLGNAIGTGRDIIGKYERDEINPSIEVAAKIADALDCSLDYLARDREQPNTELSFPSELIQKIEILNNLTSADKEHIFAIIDAFYVKSLYKKASSQE